MNWSLRSYGADWPSEFAQLDKEAFLYGVESAFGFMHSLGLAHNDTNPQTIMAREAEDGTSTPVLIDFDFTAPFGTQPILGGTLGFMSKKDPKARVSLRRHDEYSLKRLRARWD